jgi:plasmid stabilization system protein ParE
MPEIIYAPAAIRDLERLRDFLRPKNPAAAQRAGETILKAVRMLAQYPHMGRLIEDMPEEYREWLVDFGDSGYLLRYRLDEDRLTILAVRHQKEAML